MVKEKKFLAIRFANLFPSNKKIFKFNKKRRKNKKFNFRKKFFIIKKFYTKLIFTNKKLKKIKKYYTKSIPFVYYTRKKKTRRRSFFFEDNWRYKWRFQEYLKTKYLIRVWFWRKKKIKKQWRLWHNFFFFFKQHWLDNCFKYKVKRKWLGKGKNIETLVTRYQPKKKLILRFKDTYKKKLYFKKFLLRYYSFRRICQLKNLYNLVNKKPGNKVTNFFMYLESQLSSICLRMRFFWNLYKAHLWINAGVVYVNGRLILYANHLVKINDLLTVLVLRTRKKKRKTHFLCFKKRYPKKVILLNYSEVNLKSRSGILFFLPYRVEDLRLTLKKKKKHWIKAKVFAFLVNSFH